MTPPEDHSPPLADIPTVDVAIVNWNTALDSIRCAKAYLASEGVSPSVTILDNKSDAADQEQLRDGKPESVNVIFNDANPGFGAGANAALKGGSSEYVCVSNPDVIPEPTALRELIEFSAAHQDSGVVGPRFLGHSRYHAELPKPFTLPFRAMIGRFGYRPVSSPAPGAFRRVGHPAGACFVMTRKLWQELGGFDEHFFLWFEDVDLAKRAIDAGYSNYLVGSAAVAHEEGVSISRISSSRHQRIRIESLSRYTRKHHPAAYWIGLPLLLGGKFLRTRIIPIIFNR